MENEFFLYLKRPRLLIIRNRNVLALLRVIWGGVVVLSEQLDSSDIKRKKKQAQSSTTDKSDISCHELHPLSWATYPVMSYISYQEQNDWWQLLL